MRGFTKEDVPAGVIDEALEAANLAPSAGNLQARDFVVVRDGGKKRELAEAAMSQMFVADAPVVVVCCANLERIGRYGPRGRELYCLQDVAAAA
ncbi:MAG TPA: nitroreductase family protein, partial [Methanomassiliicoccaceae archaeon]|nr:nitroreductase family protein [Methanomassiliicoccaceae archaeon]